MFKNVLSKLSIKTNAYRRKAFLHDFLGKSQLFFRMSQMKLWVIWIALFKSRFNVNFISQVTKSTKLSKTEKENTARAIKKDIEAKWKQKSVET